MKLQDGKTFRVDKTFRGRLDVLSVDAIDFHDGTFALSPPFAAIDQLLNSIRAVGILSPLHVQATKEKFRIVSGFRRYRVARELGLTELPCIVRWAEDELTLFVQTLVENLGTRLLHELEKACSLYKLRHYFQIGPRSLMDYFSPLLQIPADHFHIEYYLRLADLSEQLQRAVLNGLTPQIALKIARWGSDEQKRFLELVRKYSLGKNKQKALFVLLDESCTMEQPTEGGSQFQHVWKQSGAERIDREARFPASDHFQRIMEALRNFRFPVLGQYQKRYDELKSCLGIPPLIHFQPPPYFEGDRIALSFTFRSPQELQEVAEKLRATSEKDELKEIFELL